MELRLVIILTLAFIILYWYYQKNSDANESYLLPFKISKKWNSQNQKNINEGAFSVRSTLFCEKEL